MVNYSNIFVNEGLSYSRYRDLIDSLLKNGKTTGEDHSEALLNYTKLNVMRMNRVDKTTILNEQLISAVNSIKKHYRLLVITEGWCGDAAQIVPVFNKIAEMATDRFELAFVLRDTNLPLIDAHLTKGGRAIPKLLVLDNDGVLVAEWGPRPAILQQLLFGWKSEEPDMLIVAEKLHLWYAKDKTQTTQQEIAALFKELI